LSSGSGNLINLTQFENRFNEIKNREIGEGSDKGERLKNKSSELQNFLANMNDINISDEDPNNSVAIRTKVDRLTDSLENLTIIKGAGFEVDENH